MTRPRLDPATVLESVERIVFFLGLLYFATGLASSFADASRWAWVGYALGSAVFLTAYLIVHARHNERLANREAREDSQKAADVFAQASGAEVPVEQQGSFDVFGGGSR